MFLDALSDAGSQMTGTLAYVAQAFGDNWRTGLAAPLDRPAAVLCCGGRRGPRPGARGPTAESRVGYRRARFLSANEKIFLRTLAGPIGRRSGISNPQTMVAWENLSAAASWITPRKSEEVQLLEDPRPHGLAHVASRKRPSLSQHDPWPRSAKRSAATTPEGQPPTIRTSVVESIRSRNARGWIRFPHEARLRTGPVSGERGGRTSRGNSEASHE